MAEPGLQRLEGAIRDLGARLAYPSAPALASRVRARIERAEPVGGFRLVLFPPHRTVRRSLALAFVGLLLLGGAAVATTFALRGVRIFREEPTPLPSPAPLGANLALGERVSLGEARGRVEFPVRIPAALGDPDEAWVSALPSGGRVSLVWRARPGLPAVGDSGVGALLTQFLAEVDEEFIGKVVAQGATVERVEVGGSPGLWIEGEPHEIFYRGPGGEALPDTVRLATNTLLWQVGEVTVRLEADVAPDRAVRIAESLR